MKQTMSSVLQHIKGYLQTISVGILLIAFLITPIAAKAEEITISGNGADSSSTTNTTNQSNTTITSNNNATINNDITTSSNTGGNSASNNENGNTTIATGDTQTDVAVTNAANATNVDTTACCPTPTGTTTISGNGSNSTNTSDLSNQSNTTVTSTNNATIKTNITGYANTGNNRGSYNTNGDVSITTGNIFVDQKITNSPVNVSHISLPADGGSAVADNITAEILGNGSNSKNSISHISQISNITHQENNANILNDMVWILNTGNNNANYNTDGDVAIKTGGIEFFVDIFNKVNVNEVEIDCKCKKVEKPPENPVAPTPPVTTTTTTTTSVGGQTPPTSGGQVLGAAMENILPATGNNALLFLMIGNIMLFFLGVILRLRSGNSPGAVRCLS